MALSRSFFVRHRLPLMFLVVALPTFVVYPQRGEWLPPSILGGMAALWLLASMVLPPHFTAAYPMEVELARSRIKQRAQAIMEDARVLLLGKRSGLPGDYLLLNLADLHRRQGRTADAEDFARQAIARFDRPRRSEPLALTRALTILARLGLKDGPSEESSRLAARALRLAEKHHGPRNLEVADALHVLATHHKLRCDFTTAEPFYRRCLEIRAAVQVPEHRDRVETLEAYADLLRKMKRDDEAEHWEKAVKATPVWAVRSKVDGERWTVNGGRWTVNGGR